VPADAAAAPPRGGRDASPAASGAAKGLETLESPLAAPRCPQPRRVVPGCAVTDPFACEEGRSPRSLGTDLVACREFREVFEESHGTMEPLDAIGKLHQRPLSSVSTTAGPTPTPEVFDKFMPGATAQTPSTPEKVAQPAGARTAERATPLAQPNKLFVGGIPQQMTQEELAQVLSQIGRVERAWLQKRRYSQAHQTASALTHRGFGFALFESQASVDRWLGGKSSRFLELKDWEGRMLEIKKAVDSKEVRDVGRRGHSSAANTVQAAPAGEAFPQQPWAALAHVEHPQPHPQLLALARWAAGSLAWPVSAAVPPLGAPHAEGAGEVQAHPLALLASTSVPLAQLRGQQPALGVDESPGKQLEALLRGAQPDTYED